MTRAEALLLLTHYATMHPDELPCLERVQHNLDTPLLLCALASMSGGLDDADNWDAICECIEHGRSLVSADVFSFDDWEHEMLDIVSALED